MARHLAPFSCRQRMAEIVRRRSWGGVLPLGRHVSISGSRSIHAPSVSIAPSSFQEEQNARHHKQFKLEQALVSISVYRVLLSVKTASGSCGKARETRLGRRIEAMSQKVRCIRPSDLAAHNGF